MQLKVISTSLQTQFGWNKTNLSGFTLTGKDFVADDQPSGVSVNIDNDLNDHFLRMFTFLLNVLVNSRIFTQDCSQLFR